MRYDRTMSYLLIKGFRVFGLCACVGMASCSAPNHLGNPVLLPVNAISAAIENASYDRRRGKVKAWIAEHETAMRSEQFEGPVTQVLLDAMPAARRGQARADLKEAAQHSDYVERATVLVMVLSG